MSESGRSQTPRMLVYTLGTRTTRALEPERRRPVRDWSPLDVSPDGQSVYFLSDVGDTRLLMQVPRASGQPRVLLSFANSSSPVSVDAARDGSLYLDQLLRPETIVRSSLSGGAAEEFVVPFTDTPGVVAPDGEVLLSQPTGGKRQLSAMRPGGAPRLLVNTAEETTLPATIFGDHVAFTIGSGDGKRIALASLGDGRVVRRYNSRSDKGLSASPDGKTLYYSFAGAIWAQLVDGGEPTRIADGEDVVLDPTGQHLYVKRSRKGAPAMFRLSVRGTDAEELPMPPGYQLGFPPLSPAAVDARGRVLVTVVSQSFYYKAALLDPATKSLTVIPVVIEGDVAGAGWTPDGRILADGDRYLLTLWRYQRAASVK
jgi:Tol biopolymer transport system component